MYPAILHAFIPIVTNAHGIRVYWNHCKDVFRLYAGMAMKYKEVSPLYRNMVEKDRDVTLCTYMVVCDGKTAIDTESTNGCEEWTVIGTVHRNSCEWQVAPLH